MLRAICELLEGNQSVNHTTIARHVGMSRQGYWKMRVAYPGLDAWLNQRLLAGNEHMVAAVVRKMAVMALRGSVQHAELFLKYIAGTVGLSNSTTVNVAAQGPTIIKLAVPRPGDAPMSASTKLIEEDPKRRR